MLEELFKLLNPILTLGSGIYDYRNQGRIADTLSGLSTGPQVDPFGAERPAYQAKLRDLYADPSTVANLPSYQFNLQQGMEAVNRQAAKSGKFLSTNRLHNIADYVQGLASQTYSDEADRLLTLSGANQGPDAGAFARLAAAAQELLGNRAGNISGALRLASGQQGQGGGISIPPGTGTALETLARGLTGQGGGTFSDLVSRLFGGGSTAINAAGAAPISFLGSGLGAAGSLGGLTAGAATSAGPLSIGAAGSGIAGSALPVGGGILPTTFGAAPAAASGGAAAGGGLGAAAPALSTLAGFAAPFVVGPLVSSFLSSSARRNAEAEKFRNELASYTSQGIAPSGTSLAYGPLSAESIYGMENQAPAKGVLGDTMSGLFLELGNQNVWDVYNQREIGRQEAEQNIEQARSSAANRQQFMSLYTGGGQ